MKRKQLKRRLDQAIAKLEVARFIVDTHDKHEIEWFIAEAIERLTK